MTEFVNFWKNYVNFKDRTTRKGYWMAFLFNMIAMFILGFISGLVPVLAILYLIFYLAWIIPYIAITVRRYRDAGKEWWWIFIPIANLIWLFIPSVESNDTPVV